MAHDVVTPAPPHHLNSSGCSIRHAQGKGRGVFASRRIPSRTLIEISPVLLFNKEEYTTHGRHTVLDHYTFKWNQGKMALALGLGSLFNHSDSPNVSYTLDFATESISYATTREILPDEELCIFYGHNIWFHNVDRTQDGSSQPDDLPKDSWGGLSSIDIDAEIERPINPFQDGDPDDIIPDELLPFQRFTLPPEEETPETIRTMAAWVIDIEDPRHTSTMLKWLKQNNLDDELGHLKRVKKRGSSSTMLLMAAAPSEDLPDTPLVPPPKLSSLPQGLSLSVPYTTQVPSSVALTPISHQLKNDLWPTVFAPSRKEGSDAWTRGKARWAWDAVQYIVSEAVRARGDGEVPIVAHVPLSYDSSSDLDLSFTSHDTRHSTNHPLRHAVMNVIRQVADYRSSHPAAAFQSLPDVDFRNDPLSPMDDPIIDGDTRRNGSHYLLTALTLFTTHEPCIMCSMSLLHSRVKEIVYLYPMPKTGGCGGVACLPILKGINHRFRILRWSSGLLDDMNNVLRVDDDTDA